MLTIEKSKEEASSLLMINFYVNNLDFEYLNEIKSELWKKASFIDAAAVLNRRYNPKKTEIIRFQAQALEKIIEYDTLLKKIDKLKAELAIDEQAQKDVDNLFL